MKKTGIVLGILAILLLSLTPIALAEKTITIGATATPHAEILNLIKDDYAALGYDLDIVVVTDYYISNPATASGEMDANFFQHIPFLDAYNAGVEADEKLISAIGVHCEPYGIYAGTKADLSQIAQGDAIAITNDPSNQTRALLLLSDAGLITLPEGSSYASTLTVFDIVENPYSIDIVEMNAELIPAALQDVAFAVINGNYVIEAGLSVKDDALFTEADGVSGQAYTNYVVVRPENAEADWLIALKNVLCSEKVYTFIMENESYAGGVIPAFAY